MLVIERKFLIALGAAIRENRKRLGLSAQELANRIGHKSPSHLLRIERGEIELLLDTANRIAIALDMDVNDLVGLADASIRKKR